MSFREITMVDVREVLRRMQAGRVANANGFPAGKGLGGCAQHKKR
jgi:hypothetical protein